MKSIFKFFNPSVLLYGLGAAIIIDLTLSLKFISFAILALVLIFSFGLILKKKVQKSNIIKSAFLTIAIIIILYKAAIFSLNLKSESLAESWHVEELIVDGNKVNYVDSVALEIKLIHNVFYTKNKANVLNLKYHYTFGDKLKIDGSSCFRNGVDDMPWLDYEELQGISLLGTYTYEKANNKLIIFNDLNRIILKK